MVTYPSKAQDYDFKNLSFEACTAIDAIISTKNRESVIDFLRKTNNVRAAMIMDSVDRTDRLRQGLKLDDYVEYALTLMKLKGLRPKERKFDIESDAAEAIVIAVAELVSGLDKESIDHLAPDGITSPLFAEELSIYGAAAEYVKNNFKITPSPGDDLYSIIYEQLDMVSINKLLRKFKDKDALSAYYTKELDKNPEDPRLWSNNAVLELEMGYVTMALDDFLKAATLDSKYTDGLLYVLGELPACSADAEKFYGRVLNKIDDPEMLFKLHSKASNKTAIQLLQEAAKLKPKYEYYNRMCSIYLEERKNVEAGEALTNALTCDISKFNDVLVTAHSAKIIPELCLAMSIKNYNIGGVLNVCTKEECAETIERYVLDDNIFEYFASHIKNIKSMPSLQEIALSLHSDTDILNSMPLKKAERLGDELAALSMKPQATAWYNQAIKHARSNAGLLWKKYGVNRGSLVGLTTLIELMPLAQSADKPKEAYAKILDFARQDIFENVEGLGLLLGSLGKNKSLVQQDIELCDFLGENFKQTDDKLACYNLLERLADNASIKALQWDENKFLRVSELFYNTQTRLRFLGISLEKYPGAFDLSFKKSQLLYDSNEQKDALNTIFESIKTLKETKNSKADAYITIYKAKIDDWIKRGLDNSEIKRYIDFSAQQKLNSAEQWAEFGDFLAGRSGFALAADCMQQAFSESKDCKYVLRTAEIVDRYDKNSAIGICVDLRGTAVSSEALAFIVKRIESRAYCETNLEKLLELLKNPKSRDKISLDGALEIVKSAKAAGREEYLRFASGAYDIICPILNRTDIYADKSEIEFGFDKAKSLESIIKAAELDNRFFGRVLSKGYGIELLQKNFDRLLGAVVTSADGAKLSEVFLTYSRDALHMNLGIAALTKAYSLGQEPRMANSIGTLHELLGNYPAALDFYKRAATLNKDYNNIRIFSKNRFAAKDYASASNIYEFIMSNMPQDPEANLGAGRCALESGDQLAAIEYFDKINSSSFWFDSGKLYWKSVALEKLGNFEGALEAIKGIDVKSHGIILPGNTLLAYAADIGINDILAQKLGLELKLEKTEDACKTFADMPMEICEKFRIGVACELATRAYKFACEWAIPKAHKMAIQSDNNWQNWLASYVQGICYEANNDYDNALSHYQRASSAFYKYKPQCAHVVFGPNIGINVNNLLDRAVMRCAIKYREADEDGFDKAVSSGKISHKILDGAYEGWWGRRGVGTFGYTKGFKSI